MRLDEMTRAGSHNLHVESYNQQHHCHHHHLPLYTTTHVCLLYIDWYKSEFNKFLLAVKC